MTTLNGLPRSQESFIYGIVSRRKLTKFGILWEECTQEEARLVLREENLGHDENQALAAHVRKGKRNKESHSRRKFLKTQKTQKYYPNYKCYNYQKMGHITRNYPQIKY